MKTLLNFAVFVIISLLWVFCPQNLYAQTKIIRIQGFDGRNAWAIDGIDTSDFPPESLPFLPEVQSMINSTDLFARLGSADLFGENGLCPCDVEILDPLDYLDSGSLVDTNGNLLIDIFFVGQIRRPLDSIEARELKAFMQAGGVVHMAGGNENNPGFGYEKLWQELGWEGSPYYGFYDQIPPEAVETNEIFAKSKEIINTPYEPGIFGMVQKVNYLPVFLGINTDNLVVQAMSGSLNSQPIIAGAHIGKGYLSVSGVPLYVNFNNLLNDNNLKYFQNMVGWVCEGKPAKIVPFLDLPWDYESKGMSFNDAAMAINSYFDHEYPLLSTFLKEPEEAIGLIVNYQGYPRINKSYSSHDGYDYGSGAKTKEGTPVLAAASGCAYYRYTGGVSGTQAGGNEIHIIHDGNGTGFQTRYYHLQENGLVTTSTLPSECVYVNKGQQIGLVGHSGYVKPGGVAGSHIHFMVIQDKNGDGNFDDNIPDGVVDPYGWQSTEPDPWPLYSFFYKGEQRRGTRSQYLWTKAILNLSSTLDSNAAYFEADRYFLDFPDDSVAKAASVAIKASNHVVLKKENNVTLESIFFPISVEIIDSSGNLINNFPNNYLIEIDLSGIDLTRYVPDSLSFYSSSDGISWAKEPTVINLENLWAETTVNHASYFAFMGELLDSIAPTTIVTLAGNETEIRVYSSDVEVTLTAQDNEGGSGIAYTTYSLNGSEWADTNTFTVSGVGEYIIEYYSEDNEGNAETIKSTTFRIIEPVVDTTPPEAEISFNPTTYKIEIKGIDESDVNVEITEGQGVFAKDTVLITDASGNTLKIVGVLLDSYALDSFSIDAIQYNNGEIIRLNKNVFTAVAAHHWRTQKLTHLMQSWFDKGDTQLLIQYNPKKNISNITKKDFRQKPDKVTIEGMALMYINTNNGNLEYSYE